MATKPAAPPSLTFPRPIFASVSPYAFLQAHLSAAQSAKTPIRANGRAAHESRVPAINTGSLTYSNGSAVVRLGNTSVVCGVRAEILKEEGVDSAYLAVGRYGSDDSEESDDREELESQRLLVPNVELATGSTPAHIPGNAPTAFAQTLITRIKSLIHSTRLVRASDLRILHRLYVNTEDQDGEAEVKLKGYWVLYIDVFFISIDGNAFDASWLSILAALRDTLLPRSFFDEECEGILCSNEPSEAQRLSLRGLPIPSTFAVFEGKQADGEGTEAQQDWVISDPDTFEEGVCRESVTVVVDGSSGRAGPKEPSICRIEKNGGGVVDREMMRVCVKAALNRWKSIKSVLDGAAQKHSASS